MLVGASSFVVSPPRNTRVLFGALSEDQMTETQLKIKDIQEKWTEYRHYSREEAQEKLDGEWLEAYNRFYEKYDEDMEGMTNIVQSIKKQIEPPKVLAKTKGQRKRDAWARVQAREAARAASAAK